MGVVVVVSVAHCAGVCSAVGAHGWNISKSSFWHGLLVVVSWREYGSSFSHFCVGGVVGKAVRGVRCRVVFGALLGPEATGPFCSNAGNPWCFLLFLRPARPRVCVGWVWLTGLLFENYIVDASIWTHGPALFLGVWVVCSSNFFDE